MILFFGIIKLRPLKSNYEIVASWSSNEIKKSLSRYNFNITLNRLRTSQFTIKCCESSFQTYIMIIIVRYTTITIQAQSYCENIVFSRDRFQPQGLGIEVEIYFNLNRSHNVHLTAHVVIRYAALKLISCQRKRRILFHETQYISYSENALH